MTVAPRLINLGGVTGLDQFSQIPAPPRGRPEERSTMAKISYIDATCIYEGATAPSVPELSLDVEDGEFMVLVGPIRSRR